MPAEKKWPKYMLDKIALTKKSRQKLIDETADKLIADNMETFLALAK